MGFPVSFAAPQFTSGCAVDRYLHLTAVSHMIRLNTFINFVQFYFEVKNDLTYQW